VNPTSQTSAGARAATLVTATAVVSPGGPALRHRHELAVAADPGAAFTYSVANRAADATSNAAAAVVQPSREERRSNCPRTLSPRVFYHTPGASNTCHTWSRLGR
jgi:hypothetical protein